MRQRRGRKPVKQARSAGGVVFTRDSMRAPHPSGAANQPGLAGAGPRVLLLKHESGKWMLPKGTIETGETPQEVALREVREETGLSNVRLISDLGVERYFFFWRSEDTYYDKTVHYFLLEFLGGEEPVPQTEEGFVTCEWASIDDALERIKYKETREVVRRAKEVLESDQAMTGLATPEPP